MVIHLNHILSEQKNPPDSVAVPNYHANVYQMPWRRYPGNIARIGITFRDNADLPFSQLIVDYITSFARSHNPNPDRGFIQARGYYNTLSQLDRVGGVWKAVTYTTGPIQTLD